MAELPKINVTISIESLSNILLNLESYESIEQLKEEVKSVIIKGQHVKLDIVEEITKIEP